MMRWIFRPAIAVAASGLMFVAPLSAQSSMGAGTVRGKNEVDKVVSLAKRHKSELDRISAEANVGYRAANFERLLQDREVWPHLITDAMSAVASAGANRCRSPGMDEPEACGDDGGDIPTLMRRVMRIN